MPNPYGITEVDLPGIYGAVSNLRSQRVQQMLGEQQIRQSQAALDRQARIQQVLAGAYGRQLNSGTPAGANGTGAGSPAAPAAAASPSPGAAAATAAAPASPAAAPPYQLSPEIAAQLIAIDPEQGGQIVAAFRQMDTAQRERIAAANGYLANFAQYLTGVPADQRPAEIQRRAPDLMAHGITAEQIQGFTPDDNSLRYVITSARDIEKLAEEARPNLREVQGELIDVSSLPRGTSDSPVVYRSPYISSGAGVYTRPGAGVPAATQGPPQPGEVRRGYRYNGGDPANPQSWTPVGAAPASSTGPAPDWPVPGGAASVPRNFP